MKNNLTTQKNEFQVQAAGHETHLTQVTNQLLAVTANLEREIMEKKYLEDEYRQSTDQLRELSARLQSIREEERTHIALTIHDELGQALTGLKMDIAWLQNHLDQPRSVLLKKMQMMSDLTDSIIKSVRRIATELRPGILDVGLVAAIEWALQEFQARSGIESKFINAPDDLSLDREGATVVFRIFQEILTNVARHAQASSIEVKMEENTGWVILQVTDDGQGIAESEIHNPKSIGLLGMRERARSRAGDVLFHGIPGRGTTVTIRIPCIGE
ncbi:Sensor histidine kinase [Gammaproteobacteria bacterium]